VVATCASIKVAVAPCAVSPSSVPQVFTASCTEPQSLEVVLTFSFIAVKICALTNPKFHKLRVFFEQASLGNKIENFSLSEVEVFLICHNSSPAARIR
jgi:hypothetical protein